MTYLDGRVSSHPLPARYPNPTPTVPIPPPPRYLNPGWRPAANARGAGAGPLHRSLFCERQRRARGGRPPRRLLQLNGRPARPQARLLRGRSPLPLRCPLARRDPARGRLGRAVGVLGRAPHLAGDPRSGVRIHVSLPALERDTCSAAFRCTPLYSLSSSPLYSRGALNTLLTTAFPRPHAGVFST